MIIICGVTFIAMIVNPSYMKLKSGPYVAILLSVMPTLAALILGIYRPMRRLMANVAYKRWMKTFGETADDGSSQIPSTRSNRSSWFRSSSTSRSADMMEEEELRLIVPHQSHFDSRV